MYLNVYNAISIDGFIAGATGDTSWTAESDWKLFKQTVAEFQSKVMLGINSENHTVVMYDFNEI